MSHTVRWYQKKENIIKFQLYYTDVWKLINPFFYSKECKAARIELRRKLRHRNNIRIAKGMDILPEIRTCGWNTW